MFFQVVVVEADGGGRLWNLQGGHLVYHYGIGVQRHGSAIDDKKDMWKDLSRHAE